MSAAEEPQGPLRLPSPLRPSVSYLIRNHKARHTPTAITSTTMMFVLSAPASRMVFSSFAHRDPGSPRNQAKPLASVARAFPPLWSVRIFQFKHGHIGLAAAEGVGVVVAGVYGICCGSFPNSGCPGRRSNPDVCICSDARILAQPRIRRLVLYH
jgi:hypothetical protein